ncbi:hypothetical protein BJF78_31655 [Pseudonocardia sp. CNS-139]|nr:hypothetical protein BJF78_31655 [Pseudonocardia sp. CNS-139]
MSTTSAASPATSMDGLPITCTRVANRACVATTDPAQSAPVTCRKSGWPAKCGLRISTASAKQRRYRSWSSRSSPKARSAIRSVISARSSRKRTSEDTDTSENTEPTVDPDDLPGDEPAPGSHSSTIQRATSSGRPRRPSGIVAASRCLIFSICGSGTPEPASSPVSVGPGDTAFTRIPAGASSSAQLRVRLSSAAFAAA